MESNQAGFDESSVGTPKCDPVHITLAGTQLALGVAGAGPEPELHKEARLTSTDKAGAQLTCSGLPKMPLGAHEDASEVTILSRCEKSLVVETYKSRSC